MSADCYNSRIFQKLQNLGWEEELRLLQENKVSFKKFLVISTSKEPRKITERGTLLPIDSVLCKTQVVYSMGSSRTFGS